MLTFGFWSNVEPPDPPTMTTQNFFSLGTNTYFNFYFHHKRLLAKEEGKEDDTDGTANSLI